MRSIKNMDMPVARKIRPLVSPGLKKPLDRAALSLAMRVAWRALPQGIYSAIKSESRLEKLLRESDERSGRSAVQGMMIESIETVPANETAIVSRLIESAAAALDDQTRCPPPYAPGAQWKILLDAEWANYREALGRRDVATMAGFLRNFFRNEGLSGFWGGERMFESFAALDGAESLERAGLMQRQFDAWREALPAAPVAELNALPIGNPWGYAVEGQLLYEPVCEYHYQASYFATLLSGLEKPVILEIGGGFGGLAYQIVKRIPGVKYVGFDLPENVLLQGYYLSCAFPDAKILTYERGMRALTRATVDEYDIVLLPNFMIPEVESAAVDLVVNVRSLSEMPAQTIEEYLRQIDRMGRLFFFHENIYKKRRDAWHGIPTPDFPKLQNFSPIAESESRWPRYDKDSAYPCHEYLFLHRAARARAFDFPS